VLGAALGSAGRGQPQAAGADALAGKKTAAAQSGAASKSKALKRL